MKRLRFIIASVLLIGFLFISTEILSKALLNRNPARKTFFYGMAFTYHPNLLNTFNHLFPIYSYEKDVCRKPFNDGFSFLNNQKPFSQLYQYEGFSYRTRLLGTRYLHVKGNMVYKSGNALLLVPHAYLMPATPAFNPEMPQMLLPGSN